MMSVEMCKMKISHSLKRSILDDVMSSMLLYGDDWRCCVEYSLGEVLSNLIKMDSEACVRWKSTAKGLIVSISSDSYEEYYDKLSEFLGYAKQCIDKGIGCNFLEDEHGLGHFLIAALTSKSFYRKNGTLTLVYLKDRIPDLKHLKLVEVSP